jgi:hypothetical protein
VYLAVLLDTVEPPDADREPAGADVAGEPADVIGAFARQWLDRLPLAGETSAAAKLRSRSLAGVFEAAPGRAALAGLAHLEALLLARALESTPGTRPSSTATRRSSPGTRRSAAPSRRVRLAELVLTLLNGARHLAETAPGFGDPFDVTRACRHLAGLDLADAWDPPHLPYVTPARPTGESWAPPAGATDLLTGTAVALDPDGVIVILGTGRLDAAEEAVRAARPGESVTVAVVTGDPAELGALVRLRVGDLAGCLRRAAVPAGWPGFRLLVDDHAAVASALGVRAADDTEAAVRVRAGRIVARAQGRGAGHAAAAAGTSQDRAER